MKTIGSLGLIRGLIAQIIGTALGMGLVMLIRQFEGNRSLGRCRHLQGLV
jgi:hypothetical protein